MELSSGQNYIIFLKLGKKLPLWYGKLVRAMREFDIDVVPMGADDLRELPDAVRMHVLSFNDGPSSHKAFQEFRARYLDFAINRKKIVLYDLSSFAPVNKKFVFNGVSYYWHIPLPLPLDLVVRLVAGDYYNNWNADSLWPGGKRSRLPDQGRRV